MIWLLWTLLACDVAPPGPSVETQLVAPPPPDDTAPESPVPLATGLPEPAESTYAATHVLVSFAGARGAPADVRRSREEALELARALYLRAEAGEPLEQLARCCSDDPTGRRGGTLGAYRVGTLEPAFERAVASVEERALAPLVETSWGFHVIRRDPVHSWSADQVWVSWSGARLGAVPRTRAEAEARIREARDALNQGLPFEEVVLRWSEADERLGPVGPGQLEAPLEQALKSLRPGEVSDVVESAYGFHLLRRDG